MLIAHLCSVLHFSIWIDSSGHHVLYGHISEVFTTRRALLPLTGPAIFLHVWSHRINIYDVNLSQRWAPALYSFPQSPSCSYSPWTLQSSIKARPPPSYCDMLGKTPTEDTSAEEEQQLDFWVSPGWLSISVCHEEWSQHPAKMNEGGDIDQPVNGELSSITELLWVEDPVKYEPRQEPHLFKYKKMSTWDVI